MFTPFRFFCCFISTNLYKLPCLKITNTYNHASDNRQAGVKKIKRIKYNKINTPRHSDIKQIMLHHIWFLNLMKYRTNSLSASILIKVLLYFEALLSLGFSCSYICATQKIIYRQYLIPSKSFSLQIGGFL